MISTQHTQHKQRSQEQRNFTLYHSNHLDILKDLLIHLIKSEPLNDPFSTEQIIIQSQGMEQWLNQEIAQALDISANIAFPYPSSFIWEQYTHVLDSIPAANPLTREKMRWKIMHILPDLLHQPEFAALKYYLTEDELGIKRFQLAEKIAEIFDQYLVYRPQWIVEWEAGNDLTAVSQTWQPMLWRELINSWDNSCHRVSVFKQFEEQLSYTLQEHTLQDHKSQDLAESLPERIFIFGVSAIPPQYLQVLEILSEHCPVHLFFHNPCQQYWIDLVDKKTQAKRTLSRTRSSRISRQRARFDQSGEIILSVESEPLIEDDANNSLLASMGQLGQDFYKQLLVLGAREIEAFASYGCEGNSRELSSTTLLTQVQNELLHLLEPAAEKRALSAEDMLYPSIAFHRCHSPVREIEILHDQLLNLFARDTELTPKDVVVMIPDIDQYSPFIQAVFDHFDTSDNRYIPFSISDRSVIRENPIITSFIQLLKLPQSRCSANELLSILEVPAVLKQFQFCAEDMGIIRPWIKQTGIRWGLDQQDSELFELPVLESNHWQFGLQRMFAGYAMPESTGLYHGKTDDILPYDGIEGNNAELLGKLALYIETITEFRRSLQGKYSITEWYQLLKRLIENFYFEDQQSSNTLALITQCLAELEEEITEAIGELDNEIEQALIVTLIESTLQQQTSSQKFLSGKVNFCSLMPMRAIPFKIVCLLGMNDGIFPSNRVQQSFDLLNSSYINGDRSHRDDERYMFLEALISARQQLYLSYVGRNINDNSEKIPSVLVSELQEYCEQRFKLAEAAADNTSVLSHLVTQHPLQPFSPAYYKTNQQTAANSLFSYVHEWLPGNEQETSKKDPLLQINSSERQRAFSDKQRAFSAQQGALSDEQRAFSAQQGALRTKQKAFSDEQKALSILSLEELIRFFSNPCQYYLNQSQHVYFTQSDELLEDSEPFKLDSLQTYQLKMDLINWQEKYPQDPDYSDFVQRELKRGQLGYHLTAKMQIKAGIDEVNELLSRADSYKNISQAADKKLLFIDFLLPSGIRMEAPAMMLYLTGIIECRPAKTTAKNKLKLWLMHLVVCANDDTASQDEANNTLLDKSCLKTFCVNNDLTLVFETVQPQQAVEYLQQLLELYQQGLQRPLAFFPESSFSLMAEGKAGAAKKFNGGFNSPGERDNAYIQRCYTDFDSIPLQQMQEIAQTVFQPMKNYLTEIKDDALYLAENFS